MNKPFYLTKISDVGTSNPIVARLTAGLPEIVELVRLNKEDKQKIKDLLFDISQELIEAEKCALEVIQEIEQIEARISLAAEKQQPCEMPTSIESALSLNRSRDFLKYSLSSFRKLGQIISVIFKIGNKEHRFWNVINDLKKNGSDSEVLNVLLHYKPWYQKVIDLRDDDEHRSASTAFLLNYEVKKGVDFYYLERPSFNEGTKVYDFLSSSLKILLLFCEDVVVSSLVDYLPEMIEVVEIPESQRNSKCPKRFRLTLPGHP